MRKIFFLAFLSLLIAVSTVYAVDAQIRFPKGECYADGTLKFSIIHIGRPLFVPEVNVSAIYEGTNDQKFISGNWTMYGDQVKFIGSGKASDPTEVFFISNPGLLTKSGKYVITISFLKEAGLEKFTNVMFAVDCPGMQCNADYQCDDNSRCIGGSCSYLDCKPCEYVLNHQCIDKCNDNNPCTEDICNEGTCSHKKRKNCCSDDSQCNDDLTCTTDKCINNKCEHQILTCKNSFDPCLIGTCQEPFGCMYVTDENCVNASSRRYSIILGSPEVVNKIPTWKQLLNGFKGFVDSILKVF